MCKLFLFLASLLLEAVDPGPHPFFGRKAIMGTRFLLYIRYYQATFNLLGLFNTFASAATKTAHKLKESVDEKLDKVCQ